MEEEGKGGLCMNLRLGRRRLFLLRLQRGIVLRL